MTTTGVTTTTKKVNSWGWGEIRRPNETGTKTAMMRLRGGEGSAWELADGRMARIFGEFGTRACTPPEDKTLKYAVTCLTHETWDFADSTLGADKLRHHPSRFCAACAELVRLGVKHGGTAAPRTTTAQVAPRPIVSNEELVRSYVPTLAEQQAELAAQQRTLNAQRTEPLDLTHWSEVASQQGARNDAEHEVLDAVIALGDEERLIAEAVRQASAPPAGWVDVDLSSLPAAEAEALREQHRLDAQAEEATPTESADDRRRRLDRERKARQRAAAKAMPAEGAAGPTFVTLDRL